VVQGALKWSIAEAAWYINGGVPAAWKAMLALTH